MQLGKRMKCRIKGIERKEKKRKENHKRSMQVAYKMEKNVIYINISFLWS